MTDFNFKIGAHGVVITFCEPNIGISFDVTLGQFLDTLEYILDDEDVSKTVVNHIVKRACNVYEDEKVFNDKIELDRFVKQLRKVME